MTNTWLLVDFNFLAWRAFFGHARGDPKASVASAMFAVKDYQERFSAHERTVYTFDRGPYNRAVILPTYKSTRANKACSDEEREAKKELRGEVDALVDRLRAKGEIVLWASGFEADDHIAQAVFAVPKTDHALIISRDKDLYQLLGPRCSMLDPVTNAVTTHRTFKAAWGVHPAEWPEVKAIAGCGTDDVPGLDGVAERTASDFLSGTLNAMRPVALKIREWVRSPEYIRNLNLCRLPFPGTPPADLTRRVPPNSIVFTIGFTGTRDGMTRAQKDSFLGYIEQQEQFRFRQGCCRGADEDATRIVRDHPGGWVIGHPCDIKNMQSADALKLSHEVKPVKPPLDRNRDMVEISDVVIACPKSIAEEQRSGTWATIRYAMKRGRKLIIIWPKGSVEEYTGETETTPPELKTMSRRTDPGTSKEAAEGHLSSGANAEQRRAVLDVVLQHPGRTSDEIADLAGIDRHAAARRCPELERSGDIKRGDPRPSSLSSRSGVTWWPNLRML